MHAWRKTAWCCLPADTLFVGLRGKFAQTPPPFTTLYLPSFNVYSQARVATGYIQLMRGFFKQVYQSSSKWKALYPALAPMVEPALSLAGAMLSGPAPTELRTPLLEACLMPPAPLQSLLPLLPRMVQPVTMALQVRT